MKFWLAVKITETLQSILFFTSVVNPLLFLLYFPTDSGSVITSHGDNHQPVIVEAVSEAAYYGGA